MSQNATCDRNATRSVGAIVVTFNSALTIAKCLDSIVASGSRVVVVDNGSRDETRSIVDSLGVPCLERENFGFGFGCNEGARYFGDDVDWLLFQNPDSVLSEVALNEMTAAATELEADGESVAIGPQFEGEDPHTGLSYRLWFSSLGIVAGRRLGLWRPHRSQTLRDGVVVHRVPRLSGASLLVRRSDFVAVGGFDHQFFLYYEDTDLSLRLSRSGVKLYAHSEAYVYHARGASTSLRPDIEQIRTRSLLRLAAKHRAPPFVILTVLDVVVMSCAGALVEVLRRRPSRARARLSRLRALLPRSVSRGPA